MKKSKFDANKGLTWTLMFSVFLAPLLVSTTPETEELKVKVPSGSPVVADRADNSESLVITNPRLASGGPLTSLIFGPLEDKAPEPEEKEEEEPKAEIILRENKLNYSNAIFPVEPADISSDFGWRTPPCEGCSADHHGVDFVPGHGSDVVSILDGLVVEAGINGGYGTWVMIKHLVPSTEEEGEFEEWHTIYAHLIADSIPEDVGVGSIVKKGQLIGLVGNTGQSTGSHLHFEILVNGEPEDPMPLLAQYSRVLIAPDGTETFIKYE